MKPQTATRHINRCSRAAVSSPEHLFRVFFLAIGSIRIQSLFFWTQILPKAYATYVATGRNMSVTSTLNKNFAAMEFKRTAIEWVDANLTMVWAQYLLLTPVDFFRWLVANVPGLGVAKAGFVVQMATGELGCLDTVNLQRLQVERTQSPNVYLQRLATIGESSTDMWHKWVNLVAERDGMNPVRLSEAHALFIEQGSYDGSALLS